MRSFQTNSGWPPSVPMIVIFLVMPARRSGRKAFTAWTAPRAFTLNYRSTNWSDATLSV